MQFGSSFNLLRRHQKDHEFVIYAVPRHAKRPSKPVTAHNTDRSLPHPAAGATQGFAPLLPRMARRFPFFAPLWSRPRGSVRSREFMPVKDMFDVFDSRASWLPFTNVPEIFLSRVVSKRSRIARTRVFSAAIAMRRIPPLCRAPQSRRDFLVPGAPSVSGRRSSAADRKTDGAPGRKMSPRLWRSAKQRNAALAMADEKTRVRAMRDRFETTLLKKISGTFVNGNHQARLPNTSKYPSPASIPGRR